MNPAYWVLWGWLVVTPAQTYSVEPLDVDIKFASREVCESSARAMADVLIVTVDNEGFGTAALKGRDASALVLPPSKDQQPDPNGPRIQPNCERVNPNLPIPRRTWMFAGWLSVYPDRTQLTLVRKEAATLFMHKTKDDCFERAKHQETSATSFHDGLRRDTLRHLDRELWPRGASEDDFVRLAKSLVTPSVPKGHVSLPIQSFVFDAEFKATDIHIRALCVKIDPDSDI